jgi:hypothetical protein
MDSRRARTAQMIRDGTLVSPAVRPNGAIRSLLGAGLAGPSRTIRVEPLKRFGGHSDCLEAPDLIEPVTAFHSWRVIDGELCSAHQPLFSGDPGLERFGFGGGVYAHLEPDCNFPRVDHRGVTGIVTLWGQIEVQVDGMRAEHARIVALALYSRSSARLKGALYSLADQLGIDLIDLDEIEAAAAGYGNQLPASLLPSPA